MITSIEIENLRGIRHGRLEGLGPLTILTGPNASGKSTVLDALLIGANPNPAEGAGRAVQRRPKLPAGSRWLCTDTSEVRIALEGDQGRAWERHLTWSKGGDEKLKALLTDRGAPPPFSTLHVPKLEPADRAISGIVVFASNNDYEARVNRWFAEGIEPEVRIVDPGLPKNLEDEFADVMQSGRREHVDDLLSRLVPKYERLEFIRFPDGSSGLVVTSAGRSVPLAVSGDGIQAFVQLAVGLAVAAGGLVLVEEPEVYQHPRAIWQSALALLENVRRGVQVVATTHSLELIDALLAQAEDTLGEIVLFNVLLEDGELKSGRRDGDQIAFARQTLERDLR